MMIRYMDGLFPTRKPLSGKTDALTWLEYAGYIKTVSPGCVAFLPMGTLVLENISQVFREVCIKHSLWEIHMPLLQRKELWERSGRIERYGEMLGQTIIGGKQVYVINPTQEEAILELFYMSGFNARDLPVRLFHVGDRVRNEIRPAHGLIRGRCFVLGDIYCLSLDEREADEQFRIVNSVLVHFLEWTGLKFHRGNYSPPTFGVDIHSFWIESATKQCEMHVCLKCQCSYRFTNQAPRYSPCCKDDMAVMGAVEIGDIMQSGKAFSEKMGISPANSSAPIHVTVAGIGLSRLIQLLAEDKHDDKGLMWPLRMAPFSVHIISSPVHQSETIKLAQALEDSGYKVLIDQRDLSIGRSLIDADMIGIPIRVLLGKHHTIDTFEISVRRTKELTMGNKEKLFVLVEKLRNSE